MSYTAGQKLRASQMSVYVCTSSTHPTGHSGQIIYETDTGMFLAYIGSAFVDFAASAAVSHIASYTQTIAQTIPTGTDRPLGFNNAVTTTADVTQGTSTGGTIANGKFTLNRAGVWTISAGIRWTAPNSASQYGLWIGPDNATSRYAAQFQNVGGTTAFDQTCTITDRFASGATFNAYAFQNSGGNEDTVNLNGSTFFRAIWIRP
jgi:hypothetical protein